MVLEATTCPLPAHCQSHRCLVSCRSNGINTSFPVAYTMFHASLLSSWRIPNLRLILIVSQTTRHWTRSRRALRDLTDLHCVDAPFLLNENETGVKKDSEANKLDTSTSNRSFHSPMPTTALDSTFKLKHSHHLQPLEVFDRSLNTLDTKISDCIILFCMICDCSLRRRRYCGEDKRENNYQNMGTSYRIQRWLPSSYHYQPVARRPRYPEVFNGSLKIQWVFNRCLPGW